MYHSLIQVLSAARLLARPQGVGIAELQDNIGVSRRTVYRLLDALDELGYPFYDANEGGRERRYKLVEGRDNLRWWLSTPAISFDIEDRVMLDYLFQTGATATGLSGPLRKLQNKLALIGATVGYPISPKEGGAGPPSRRRPVLLRTAPVGKLFTDTLQTTFDSLLRATKEHRVCIVSYAAISTGAVKTYPVHPLAIFEDDGGLYAFVVVPHYGSIRILALERVRSLDVGEEIFTPPEGFDAGERLSDPFGIILDEPFRARIRFFKEQAPYIRERSWPEGTLIEEMKDGSIVLSLETAGEYGLKRWILSFGSMAEAIEPAWLRDGIAEELAATAIRYRTSL